MGEELERKLRNIEQAKRRVESQRDDFEMELQQVSSQVANISNIEKRYERELQALREQVAQTCSEKDAANNTARQAEQRAYQYKTTKEGLVLISSLFSLP